jgi:clan AA aspartic protease
MITGVVTAANEPMVRVTVRGPAGRERDIEAVIDTGFDGSLALPPTLIEVLGLPWRRRGRALLADGRETLFDIYEAAIVWDRQPRRVAVDAVDPADRHAPA